MKSLAIKEKDKVRDFAKTTLQILFSAQYNPFLGQ